MTRQPLSLGRFCSWGPPSPRRGLLLAAVVVPGLVRQTHHEVTILELVLHWIAVVSARLLQQLLEVVGSDRPLLFPVGRRDLVGRGPLPVSSVFLPFPSGGAFVGVFSLGRRGGLLLGEDRPDRLLAGGVVGCDVQELAGGAWFLASKLVHQCLACGSCEESADDISVNNIRE